MIKKRWKKAVISLLLIILLITGIRVYLPFAVRDYVNKKLDELPDYDGHISDVDLALIRGAYTIKDMQIVKTGGKVPVPFFSNDVVDFSVQWGALFEGKIVAEVEIKNAKLNFVNGPSEKQSQTEMDSEWLGIVKDLFPLRINRFAVHNGEIHYRDFHSSPKVDIAIFRIEIEGTDLSNSRSPAEGLISSISANGLVEKTAPLNVAVKLEPAANSPTFDMNLSVKSLEVKLLNDFLRAYAAVDAENGTIGADIEIAAAKNRFKGYVKPIAKDLSILSLKQDIDNPLLMVWESFVGFWNLIFENQRHDQLAAEIPFSGSLENPQAGIWSTIGSVLHNAFIEALKAGNENKIDLRDIK